MIQKCAAQTKVNSINLSQKRADDKKIGHAIAHLERQLQNLDHFEDDVKNNMQDRMKFMSGKNARQKNAELARISQQQEAIRSEIKRLQVSL